jgi:hypothetical protein
VNRVFAFGSGRPASKAEKDWMAYMVKGFADDGYRLPSLLRHVATSDAFYRVTAPAEETKAADASAGAK